MTEMFNSFNPVTLVLGMKRWNNSGYNENTICKDALDGISHNKITKFSMKAKKRLHVKGLWLSLGCHSLKLERK